jgi:triphosphoribosyl-dephospho-CoA synthase
MPTRARNGYASPAVCQRETVTRWLAEAAVRALIEEANLTPKPGLVDANSSGAHTDMDLEMLHRSACSLRGSFTDMADAAFRAKESVFLRNSLSEIGRQGENTILQATGGINTHRGAIWTLGLLCASAAMLVCKEIETVSISVQAGRIARLTDSYTVRERSHGKRVQELYGRQGARGEAEGGFRHVVEIGLPMLKHSRCQGLTEEQARLNCLAAIMAELDDTCLLYRGGLPVLRAAKRGARRVLKSGGVATAEGSWHWEELNRCLLDLHASPGGSADLLAAVLFLDFIESERSFFAGGR